MIEQVAKANDFLKNEAPNFLHKLTVDSIPLWGIMTAQHMVEHLILTLKLALGRFDLPVITPVENQPEVREFFISDLPMRRSVPSPTGNDDLVKLKFENLEEAIVKLNSDLSQYLDFAKNNPEFTTNHPYGGPMNALEWTCFHKKHFIHHFTQFGLI